MHTINKIPPNPSEEDLQAIIAFRKRFFAQAYPNDELPNFKNWQKAIQQAYKNRKGYAFYTILADGQIIANIRHVERESSKRSIMIDHDREKETTELHQLLCKQLNEWKKEIPTTIIETRTDFMGSILEACDFQKGNEAIFTSLQLTDLNPDMLDKWTQDLPSNLTYSFMKKPNEKECVEIAEITNFLLNDMERPDKSLTYNFSLEDFIKMIQNIHESGSTTEHVLLRNEQGKLIGKSVVVYNLQNSSVGGQKMTGVLPEYRRKGLAKFLKAAMYKYLIENEPELKTIKTDYFAGNYKIRKLNEEMGFREDYLIQQWYFKN